MIDIKHELNMLSRYATGRDWKGQLQRSLVKMAAEKIKGITDELQAYAIISDLLIGTEIDTTVLLNDELYTVGSTGAMLGNQTETEGGRLSVWEFILDLPGVGTLQERLDAIVSALINSGSISMFALENALQNAGFDVYVHKNTSNILFSGEKVTLSMTNNLGGKVGALDVRLTYGSEVVDPDIVNSTLCVNFIDETKDETKYRSNITLDERRWEYAFFIGGETKLSFANVEEYRKDIFREIILKTKPCGMWAVLLINYI